MCSWIQIFLFLKETNGIGLGASLIQTTLFQLDYIKNEIVIKKLFDFLKANNSIEKPAKAEKAE